MSYTTISGPKAVLFPNKLELAAHYHINQGSIRRSLKELVDEGILIRLQGKRTFVASFSKNLDRMRQASILMTVT